MPTSATPQSTDFSLDVLGRYICNGFDEAKQSADQSLRADAKPFDMIIIGGGTFGAVLASHLFQRDKTRQHRILVLEAGPLTLPEHQQNLPMINPGEVWGVPWNSDSPQTWNQQFPGLAFTVGGRSLYWGGWSPYFIDSELPTPLWLQSVKDELTQALPQNGNIAYLDQSAQQIGTMATNDFINGVLHEQLRGRLFQGLQARAAGQSTVLTGNRGALNAAPDLEAPLAVESTESRPGLFPFNKFSATPILTRTSRLAFEESLGDDVRKRFMVVDKTHVIRLEMAGKRVARIVTNQGTLDVPDTGQVFLALGTIENTRLALNTLPNANGLIGRNLMAHLRSNLTIRIPRTSFGAALDPNLHPELKELAVSALFVKGIHQHSDNSLGHFHVQVTASAVGDLETNSEAELFKKIPDIDGLDQFKGLTDQWVVITLRGIGEMVGDKTSPDPVNRITSDRLGAQGPFDYGQPRAKIRLEVPVGSKDMNLWDAMDQACDELALLFAAGNPNDIQYLSSQRNGVWQRNPPDANNRRDTLSSTHHEGGTLWMGTPGNSVTDEWGRFHESDNLYAIGPALLPTLGSPNPMLSGVALARRTADHLIPQPVIPNPETGFKYLFDGTAKSFKGWLTAGKGQFSLIDGNIVAYPGSNLGLLWYALENFGDFTLRLQFKLAHPTGQGNDNSGVFVRFRDPRRRVPDRNNPNVSYIYDNTAFVAVDTGFEIQIDEEARGNPNLGAPDGLDEHRTGAVYAIPIGAVSGQQKYQRGPAIAANQWYEFEIKVVGDAYTIKLKDTLGAAFQQTSTFTNADSFRGKPLTADPNSGYIGLQSHTGLVAFRNIRIKTA